jgi:hypothetical protein
LIPLRDEFRSLALLRGQLRNCRQWTNSLIKADSNSIDIDITMREKLCAGTQWTMAETGGSVMTFRPFCYDCGLDGSRFHREIAGNGNRNLFQDFANSRDLDGNLQESAR